MSRISGPPDFVPYLELSKRQQAVLQFLWNWPFPYSPSMREIGDAVGLNGPSPVRYQLDELEGKGWVLRHSKRPRALEVRGSDGRFPVRPESSGTGYLRLPELGFVPAGRPNEAVQVYEDGWDLPVELVGNGELFLLRVHGDSMIDAAIVDGDWVAVRKQQHAENGEIVVAMIDGDATVKSLRRTADGRVSLVAQNPAYPPIPAESANIRGKVVAVLRRT
jgi:repressor LexA